MQKVHRTSASTSEAAARTSARSTSLTYKIYQAKKMQEQLLLSTGLSTEAAARTSADSSLTSRLSSEEDARASCYC